MLISQLLVVIFIIPGDYNTPAQQRKESALAQRRLADKQSDMFQNFCAHAMSQNSASYREQVTKISSR